MNKEKNYYVKFEIFYGVHHGIPGCPITESKNIKLDLNEKDDPYLETAKYLVNSGRFPTSSGYLKAKVFEIGYNEKTLEQNVLIKMSSLELIIARERKRRNATT